MFVLASNYIIIWSKCMYCSCQGSCLL